MGGQTDRQTYDLTTKKNQQLNKQLLAQVSFLHKSLLAKTKSPGALVRPRWADQCCAPSAGPVGPAPSSAPSSEPTGGTGSSSGPAGAAAPAPSCWFHGALAIPVRADSDTIGTADTKVPAGHAGPAGPAGPAIDRFSKFT